jgi:hypothetical protein
MTLSIGCANYKFLSSSPPNKQSITWLENVAEYECYLFQDSGSAYLRDARIQDGNIVGTLVPLDGSNLLQNSNAIKDRMNESDRGILDELHIHLIDGMSIPFDIETTVPIHTISEVHTFKSTTTQKVILSIVFVSLGLLAIGLWGANVLTYGPD